MKNGMIRRCFQCAYDPVKQKEVGKEFLFRVEQFNDKGNITRLEVFDEKGNTVESGSFSYNEDGLIMEEVLTYPAEGIGEKRTYAYDNASREVRITNHFHGGESDTTIRRFDEQDNCIAVINNDEGQNEQFLYRDGLLEMHLVTTPEGEELMKKIYIYEGGKKPARHEVFTGGELQETTEYHYREDGKFLGMLTFDADGREINAIEAEYEGDILARETVSEYGAVLSAHEYVHDQKGNRVEHRVSYGGGEMKKIKRFVYGERNEVLQELSMDSHYEDENFRIRYEYEA